MPLVLTGKNDINIDYNLPKRKRNLLTKEFLQTFKQELDRIFEIEENATYWSRYNYLEGTSGFYEALKITC